MKKASSFLAKNTGFGMFSGLGRGHHLFMTVYPSSAKDEGWVVRVFATRDASIRPGSTRLHWMRRMEFIGTVRNPCAFLSKVPALDATYQGDGAVLVALPTDWEVQQEVMNLLDGEPRTSGFEWV